MKEYEVIAYCAIHLIRRGFLIKKISFHRKNEKGKIKRIIKNKLGGKDSKEFDDINFEGKEEDISGIDKKGKRIIIEAKGESKAIGVDINTGVGQIIERISRGQKNCKYILAFPDSIKYKERLKNKLSEKVKEKLNLKIIYINREEIKGL